MGRILWVIWRKHTVRYQERAQYALVKSASYPVYPIHNKYSTRCFPLTCAFSPFFQEFILNDTFRIIPTNTQSILNEVLFWVLTYIILSEKMFPQNNSCLYILYIPQVAPLGPVPVSCGQFAGQQDNLYGFPVLTHMYYVRILNVMVLL